MEDRVKTGNLIARSSAIHQEPQNVCEFVKAGAKPPIYQSSSGPILDRRQGLGLHDVLAIEVDRRRKKGWLRRERGVEEDKKE